MGLLKVEKLFGLFKILMFTFTVAGWLPVGKSEHNSIVMCRDRDGSHDPELFRMISCAYCYGYLFPNDLHLVPYFHVLVTKNSVPPKKLVPDIHVDGWRNRICSYLSRKDCYRWIDCCTAAEVCCDQQINSTQINNKHVKNERSINNISSQSNHSLQVDMTTSTCPHTWDGFSCWKQVSSGTHHTQLCPSFLTIIPGRDSMSSKHCTDNGTWYRDSSSNMEWTDYTGCADVQAFHLEMDISIVCCVISLAFLIPAIVIFMSYKSLRKQPRIKLHIHLFASFILTSFINLLWECVVVRDRMIKPTQESVLYNNPPGCRFLYVLTRYIRSTNFTWMFCEGYFLHRLVTNAFKPPRSVLIFGLVGWLFPVIPVSIYSVIKHLHQMDSCWLKNIGESEWIIYAPNLISLVANFAFLVNILRILVTQVQVHPNEPSNYRRALKATLILVPLFGLQLFVIIYRPSFGSAGWKQYEVFSTFITQSQGFFVAVILCYVNKEVYTLLQATLSGHKERIIGTKSQKHKYDCPATESQECEPDNTELKRPLNVYVTSC